MAQIADASYIGKGEIFIGPYAGGSAVRSVGNCSELTFTHETEAKPLLDFTSAGGGKANNLERITGVTIAIKAHDVTAENLALGAFGSTTAVTATAVVDEARTAYKGSLVVFANLPDTSLAIVVTNSGATVTYVEGTDYVVNNAGIYVLPGSAIADAESILVDYTKKAGSVIESLVNSAQLFKLYFVGLNEAQSGRAATIAVHKFKPGAAQNIAMIGDDYAALDLPGEALSDASITGAGLSKYYTARLAN